MLTTSGHVALATHDRLWVSGYFKTGEEVPGGGVVVKKLDTTKLAAGIALTVIGATVVIAGVAWAAQSTPPCGDPAPLFDVCPLGAAIKSFAAMGVILWARFR